jgi:threonylcarbamoyladenosine tRNA methylthiotransferase MtaB
MGRHWYTADAYADAVCALTDGVRAFGLGADVIAGFPGEREADHEATLALVERLPFTHLHVFPYSARPGTAAERLGDAVDAETVARRARELRELGARKAAAHAAARAGGRADVVVVGAGARRDGLTEDYLTVAVDDDGMARGERFAATLDRPAGGGRLVARALGARGYIQGSSAVGP